MFVRSLGYDFQRCRGISFHQMLLIPLAFRGKEIVIYFVRAKAKRLECFGFGDFGGVLLSQMLRKQRLPAHGFIPRCISSS